MERAVILRVRRASQAAEPRVWYEFAPIIDGRPRRRADHMMASVETAAMRARKYGFEPAEVVLDYDVDKRRIVPE